MALVFQPENIRLNQAIRFKYRGKTLTGIVFEIGENCANVRVGAKKYFIQKDKWRDTWLGVNELGANFKGNQKRVGG